MFVNQIKPDNDVSSSFSEFQPKPRFHVFTVLNQRVKKRVRFKFNSRFAVTGHLFSALRISSGFFPSCLQPLK